MRSTDILSSKEWCDIVFEGRNKAYGAYKLRAEAGMRYRKALLTVVGSVAVLVALFVTVLVIDNLSGYLRKKLS